MSAPLSVVRVPAGDALAWLKEAWMLFKDAVLPWMGMTAAAFLALMLLALILGIGRHLVELLSPFLVAAFMAASRAAENREPVNFLHLGTGFRAAPQPLLAVGVAYLAGTLLIELAMRGIGGASLHQLGQLAVDPRAMSPEEARALLDRALPSLLLGLTLLTPLLMATLFAPALILFNGFRPGNALWWSLWACGRNWRALLVYSLLLGALGMLALIIPLGLGMLVFLPLAMISTYQAYRALFRTVTTA